jgi:hypothetical protein
MCRGPCLIGGHTLAGGGAPRTRVPYATGLRPLGTPSPSRPSYPCRYIWTGRTGVRPLPLRQGPEGLPCGLHMGGSAPSTTSYTLFPLAGNSRPPRHLRFFSPPLGFHRGVSRGEGKHGRTALVSGAGYPTTPGSPHPLIRIHTLAHLGADTPSASAAGGRQGGGRRDTKAEPGAKVNLAPFAAIGGRGTRASSGLLTPVVFQIPPWVASSAERASHIRETELSRNWGCGCRRRGCPGGLLPLDAEPL